MGRRKRKSKNTGTIDSLYRDKPKKSRRHNIASWVKTPEDVKLLEMALEYTGTSTEAGKFVFRDVVSGAMFIYAPRLIQIDPTTKRVPCLPPDAP